MTLEWIRTRAGYPTDEAALDTRGPYCEFLTIEDGVLSISKGGGRLMAIELHHIGIVGDKIDEAKEVYEETFAFQTADRYMPHELDADVSSFLSGRSTLS